MQERKEVAAPKTDTGTFCPACRLYTHLEQVEEQDSSGGVSIGLKCSQCGALFPSAYVDAQGVFLQKELNYLRRIGKGRTSKFRRTLKKYREHVQDLTQPSKAPAEA